MRKTKRKCSAGRGVSSSAEHLSPSGSLFEGEPGCLKERTRSTDFDCFEFEKKKEKKPHVSSMLINESEFVWHKICNIFWTD